MLLAGDVGATKTLLALADTAGPGVVVRFERRYADASFPSFEAVLEQFLRDAREAVGTFVLDGGCIGVAGPVRANRVQLTNRSWRIDGDSLARSLGMRSVTVVNDFAAAASGIESLGPADLLTLQQGDPDADGNRVVIGAGSGLGVAYSLRSGDGWRIVAGEGGHAAFAPETAEQIELLQHLRARAGRVSVETILSGQGLARVYEFITARSLQSAASVPTSPTTEATAAAIVARAMDAHDAAALAALDLFIQCYGQVAGDHALTMLASGGVFVAGGIAPRIVERLRSGGFMAAFNAKGESAHVVARVPVHVVLDDRLGLLGAARLASRAATSR